MKLATFSADAGPELGLISDDDRVISITRSAPDLAPDMIALIADWDAARATVERVAAAAEHSFPLAKVKLHAPVARPGKIFAIGLNYADHIEESGMDSPTEQVWFTKAVTSVNGPYDPIQIPKISPFVDYEAELVAVIGKGGKHITREEAPEHVFGFCVGNDVTERLWQHRTPQWSLGKSFDTHAPIGPWITTGDDIADVHNLGIRCFVNGDERQNSNTQHLVYDIWDQVVQLSQAMTLEPGDLLFTGTPGGIGAAMDPRQFLKAGDTVRVEIDSLGDLDAVFEQEE